MGLFEREGSGEEESPFESKGAGEEECPSESKESGEEYESDKAAATVVASTKEDGKIMVRSSPGSVILAAKKLPPDARKEVIQLGFEQLLYVLK